MNSRRCRVLPAALAVLVSGIGRSSVVAGRGPMPAAQPSAAPAAAPAPAAPAPANVRRPCENTVAFWSAGVTTAEPAMIEVPGGTHIPLVLHNAISTRSARPGTPFISRRSFRS